ncbi:MAG: hypothetical protein ACRC1T_05245 [Clostridium chrysemydis]|uniref:hypothetical protein n=1 Tax=Clostridium chrysemydis TaxID=2665504 RepID=UPI003F370F76
MLFYYNLVKDVDVNIRTVDGILNMEGTKYVFSLEKIKVLFKDEKEIILKTNKKNTSRSYTPLELLCYLSALSQELRNGLSYVVKNVDMIEERKIKYINVCNKLFKYEKQFEYLKDKIWDSLSEEEREEINNNIIPIDM